MRCNKCDDLNKKTTIREEEEKKMLTKRLNVIEGQVRGINKMIADDRYCGDVLIQIAAVSKSLQTLGNNILENHMKTCVIKEIKKGNLEVLEEVMQLIEKLQ